MVFSVEETIDAKPGEVWRHLSDASLMGRWMPGVEAMRTEDGGAVSAGKRLVFTARGAGRTSTVTECNPQQSIALTSTQGPFTATYRYSVAGKGGATRVTLDAVCAARGPAAFVAPLVRLMIRRVDSGQLRALKTAVEAAAG